MNSEDVLVLTPEDDLNHTNNDSDIREKSFDNKCLDEHESQNVSVNENIVDLNVSKNDDLLDQMNIHEDDHKESGEIGEIIKNENTPPVKIDENLLNEMKFLFKNTRYFLIKSNNYENVYLAQNKSVWSTPKANEIKLNKAYRECANVILIFSVSESGRFQGYARLASECRMDPDLQVNWILPPTLSARSLMGVFKIDWITKNDLYFTKTQHLLNSWNENRQVKIGRDGQEIEPHCGESLCRLFDLSSSSDPESKLEEINKNLNSIIKKSKRRHEELLETPASRLLKIDRSRSNSKSPRRSSEREAKIDSKVQVINQDRDYSKYKKDYQPYRRRYDDRGVHPYQNKSYYNQVPQPYYGQPTQPFLPHGAPNQIERTHRSQSPRRTDKDAPKYVELPKDIVLNSTYEEYLAAAQAMKQQTFPMQQPPFGMYDPQFYQIGYGMNQSMMPMNQPYVGFNQNEFQSSTNPSKYDQDVEEFLRQTTAPSEKRALSPRDKETSRKKEKKKESRRRNSSSGRSRSKSRDRSYRRRSKSRDRR